MSDKEKKKEEKLFCKRHSCAHVLAQAVLTMFPEAKFGIGPVIDNGFYYDFDLPRTLIPEDLEIIEGKMREIIEQEQPFVSVEKTADEALEFVKQTDQTYKIELIEGLKEKGEDITFYENVFPEDGHVTFVDLCRGPHVTNTKQIGRSFKLMSIAGAYWRGDEKNPMLQRIYGVLFDNDKELRTYLKNLEEAKKRDHRKLGKELELFTFDDEVGPGLPMWMPKGTVITEILEDLAKRKETEQGYDRVRSPHIAKDKLYIRSGHLPYYKDSMYPSMEMDNETYYLKAMNCPHHHKIYAATPKSYRDLPVRYAEYGHCYRNEDSGALFGLMRVTSLCMNDAHIYCSDEQFEEEFAKVIELYLYYFKLFGIDKYQMRLSKHSKEGLGKKYVDEEDLWIKTEDQVRKVLEKLNVPFVEVDDEAAFYGPKIDVQIWSVIGREFTLATNQLDFAVPKRFNLTYTDKDGSDKTPICIHRAPLSTHERMVGFLIEHYAGAFPVWLAPVQAKILPVNEVHNEYAREVLDTFKKAGLRVELDESDESLGKKIRNAEIKKTPYMLIIGDKEREAKQVTVRQYKVKEQSTIGIDEFIKLVEKESAVLYE